MDTVCIVYSTYPVLFPAILSRMFQKNSHNFGNTLQDYMLDAAQTAGDGRLKWLQPGAARSTPDMEGYCVILAWTIFQVVLCVLAGAYFFRQLRLSRGARPAPVSGGRAESQEMQRLRQMRKIALTRPLNECVRPTSFQEIIGQEEGVRALMATLCGKNPQHVLVYGPPGVGKTCAARLALEMAKRSEGTPFRADAPFVEMDATCLRFDERSIADPLTGSVHDPIYQGAGPLGMNGVPQPKEGAVTRANGGVLFLDEIGEMHPMQMNKLLKILEDRVVHFDSAYYNPQDTRIPAHIHDIFQNGLPADFRLIGATTCPPESIPPALRSRCMEIYFRALEPEELSRVAANAARRAGLHLSHENAMCVGAYSDSARTAVNILQLAAGAARLEGRDTLLRRDIEYVAACAHYVRRQCYQPPKTDLPGVVNALAVCGAGQGVVLCCEAAAYAGSGDLTVTGVICEEELSGGSGRTVRRTGTAKDSARVAVTALAGLEIRADKHNLHIHFPGGSCADGPSAGLAMALAVRSALLDTPVPRDLAMTGEISVRGEILPVGGVAEKLRAAELAGLKRALIPRANLPDARKSSLEIHAVSTLREAIECLSPAQIADAPVLPAVAVAN